MIKAIANVKGSVSVLVVEDDADDYEFIENTVKGCCKKASVQWVRDGDQAVDYLFHRGKYEDEAQYPNPDLIFLDIRIPKKNGLEVAKIIKEDPRLKKLPTIMLTTSSSSKDILHAYENGANSYLKKPEGSQEIEWFKKAICLFWSPVVLFPREC
ncbi:MAG: response regulator [Nitrospina sp.]|jgi:CheY-like chemotaxis protein|nr:response regulator [Nitrospina sp.]MBT5632227.1 response regulator [Nitrospina sp.]